MKNDPTKPIADAIKAGRELVEELVATGNPDQAKVVDNLIKELNTAIAGYEALGAKLRKVEAALK